jgi:hypothetical protein
MLRKKLHPNRFSGISNRMIALVACVIGEHWTSPRIVSLCVTSDGFLLAMQEGDCGFNDFIGTADEFESNWNRLLDCADLTTEERNQAERLYRQAVAVKH